MRWRDIATGLVVVTYPAFEPVSRAEAKRHCNIDHADTDHLVAGWIAAARRQLEKDTGRPPVNTVYDLTVDRFPEERAIEVPRAPLASVASITSYDEDDAATVFSASNYRADTALRRVVLNDDATWPSDLRQHSGGVIRFTAGANEAPKTITALTVAADGTATATSAAHGFATGDRRTIVGAVHEELNGTFVITVTDADHFTYMAVTGSAATEGADGGAAITARNLNLPEGHWLAMLLLIAHFAKHRESVVDGQVMSLPMGYEALIGGADRVYAMA